MPLKRFVRVGDSLVLQQKNPFTGEPVNGRGRNYQFIQDSESGPIGGGGEAGIPEYTRVVNNDIAEGGLAISVGNLNVIAALAAPAVGGGGLGILDPYCLAGSLVLHVNSAQETAPIEFTLIKDTEDPLVSTWAESLEDLPVLEWNCEDLGLQFIQLWIRFPTISAFPVAAQNLNMLVSDDQFDFCSEP